MSLRSLLLGGSLATASAAWLLASLSHPARARAEAQPGLVLVRTLGEETGVEWFGVRGAAFVGDDLVVVSRPAPAIHLFAGTRHRGWGARGSGPAEFKDPEQVAVLGGRVLVYDMELAKLASFSPSGTFVTARPAGIVRRLQVSGSDTLVASNDPSGGALSVLRLRGTSAETVQRFPVPQPIRLVAPGSPSYTVLPPYSTAPQWAGLAGGRVALWDGRPGRLVVRSLSGAPSVAFPLPATRYRVTAADRELWLAEEIPTEFMGQRVFEPVRAAARRNLRFPDTLPPVLEITADPGGGAWVRMTTAATGQTWVLVDERGPRATFRLPRGRKLLAVGAREVAALAKDADEVETVEVYRRPGAGG